MAEGGATSGLSVLVAAADYRRDAVPNDVARRQRRDRAVTVTSQRKTWVHRAVCLVALVWCGFVLLFHWVAGAFACGFDTSYCAYSHDKNGIYQGVLVDRRGRTLTDTTFTVAFESRRRAHPRDVSGFSTDAQGRYCIVWAQERDTPFAQFDSSETTIEQPWRALNGAQPPPGCQSGDQRIPWNRANDLTSSAQFLAVPAIVVPGAVLLLVAVALGAAPSGRRARSAGLLLSAASTALTALLWLM
jgi:hypothetical protein